MAVLLRPDSVRARRAEETIERAREIGAKLATARERPLAPAGVSADRAQELVDAIRAADAVHLATAVVAGADRFITNNRRDFPKSISEIDITYPEALEEW